MKGLNAFKIHVFFFKNHINLTIRRGKEMSESYLSACTSIEIIVLHIGKSPYHKSK